MSVSKELSDHALTYQQDHKMARSVCLYSQKCCCAGLVTASSSMLLALETSSFCARMKEKPASQDNTSFSPARNGARVGCLLPVPSADTFVGLSFGAGKESD